MDKLQASRWNKRYNEREDSDPQPCYALRQYSHLLPLPDAAVPRCRALDLACGRGGNALYLAHSGFDTDAWDISSVAVTALQQRAQKQALGITVQCRDLLAQPPAQQLFDVIVVSRFLERSIIPALIDALRPGGVLFYQTFTVQSTTGPANPAYLLQENELLQLFSSLQVRAFEDAAQYGRVEQGFRNEALIVASRPADKLAHRPAALD